MNKEVNFFTRSKGYNSRGLFSLVIIALCLTLFQANVSAQDSLRKQIYGSEKGKSKPPTATKPKSAAKKPPAKPAPVKTAEKKPAPARKNTSAKRNSPKQQTAPLINVAFVSQEPGVEIWLNDKKVGVTNKNSRLVKKLAPNVYILSAKKNNQIVYPAKSIIVSGSNSNFALLPEKPVKEIPKPVIVPTIAEVQKTPEEEAAEKAAKVKHILQDYADPAKTDLVTPEDWNFVLNEASSGQIRNFTAVQVEAQKWFASGQIEFAKGDYLNAFTAYTKAMEFMPKSALPFYAIGNAYLANNQSADALKAFQQAIQFEPRMGMAYKGLGDAQRLLKNKKAALSAYQSAVKHGYATPETRYRLGMMLIENERIKEGLEQLETLAKTSPTAELYVTLGDGYQQIKQNISAVESYRKAIELNTDLAIAYYKLGSLYFDENEFNKAHELLEKAVALDPDGKTFNKTEAMKKVRVAANKKS